MVGEGRERRRKKAGVRKRKRTRATFRGLMRRGERCFLRRFLSLVKSLGSLSIANMIILLKSIGLKFDWLFLG